MTDVCELIKETVTKDAIKNNILTRTYREILCEVNSIYSKEWYDAKISGLSPSFSVITPCVNYQGERELRYKGKNYKIYRTFAKGDYIELYCEEAAGVCATSQQVDGNEDNQN